MEISYDCGVPLLSTQFPTISDLFSRVIESRSGHINRRLSSVGLWLPTAIYTHVSKLSFECVDRKLNQRYHRTQDALQEYAAIEVLMEGCHGQDLVIEMIPVFLEL